MPLHFQHVVVIGDQWQGSLIWEYKYVDCPGVRVHYLLTADKEIVDEQMPRLGYVRVPQLC